MDKKYTNHQRDAELTLLEKSSQSEQKKIRRSLSDRPPLCPSKRLLVVVVLFLCLVISQVVRNHMNITVVEMTSNKSFVEGNTTVERPEFDWDSNMVALVIGIFAYGGLFSFLGGFIVKFLGGSVSCALFMVISGIATLLHPAALSVDYRLFLACRFVTGLSQTFLYVSVIQIYSRWFPLQERSKLVSFSFNGSNVGVAIVYPFCGYLAHRWGWQSVFYITGMMPLIMSVVCLIAIKNHPSQDKWISRKELEYILQGTESNTKCKSRPYERILTSEPVWALNSLVFTYMWIITNLGVCLPIYIKDLTGKPTDQVGYISSVPSIVYTLMFPVFGPLMDYCSNRGIMSSTQIHKLMISIAYIAATTFFIASTLIESLTIKMGFFVLIDMLMAIVPLITEIMLVSIAPDHTSLVAGLVIFFFSLGAIVPTTVIGVLTSHHTVQEWNNCFYLAAVVATLGVIVIVKYSSSEAQKWALSSTSQSESNSCDKNNCKSNSCF